MKRLLLIFALVAPAFSQLWTGVIDASRATDWTYAGIPGGIPSFTWAQCGPTIAPYNGTATVIINALKRTGAGYTGCGAFTYIQLGAGTFNLTTGIKVTGTNGTELRGAGASQTHLVFSGTVSCAFIGSCLVDFESSDGTAPNSPPANIYNWTAGYSKGATSLTLSSGANITVNSTILVLDQCDTGYTGAPCAGSAVDNGEWFNCGDKYATTPTGCSVNGGDAGLARVHRFQIEAVEVTACSPSPCAAGTTTVTISPPLQHPNWASGQTPQAWLVQPNRNIGVRNLSIDGAAAAAASNLHFFNLSNFWAEGVASLNSFNMGISTWFSIHGIVQSNYVYNAGQRLTNADPTGIKYNWSNNLFANNITHAVRPGFLGEGPVNGSVFIGNLCLNSYTNDDFMFGCFWNGHSNGGDLNLWESNVGGQFFQDQIHGTQIMVTTYRNLFTGFESCANGQCGAFTAKASSVSAYDDLSYNRYGNIIANVLGTPGSTTKGYTSSTNGYILGGTTGEVYILGSGNGGTTPSIPLDSTTVSTAYRWANYDVFNSGTRFVTSEVPTGISPYPQSVPTSTCTASIPCPTSFYYSSRPSWWISSIPFPAIGPDVSGGNLGICSGTLNTAGHQSGMPATSASSCIGTTLTASQWAGHANAIPAQNCYLNVMNGPADGSFATLTFDPDACYASPTAPAVSLIPASLDFGLQTVGTSSPPQTATLTNIGNAQLTINSFLFTGDFALGQHCGTTPVVLAINASCTITASFVPSVSGTRTGSVTISDDASDSPQILPLTGVGTTGLAGIKGNITLQGTIVIK